MPAIQTIQEPKSVSVVVPLYNKAPYIQTTLKSIVEQTRGALEVIVVNDGSTDNSVEQVEAIQDDRIRLIHQDNAGPGAARNRGLEIARAQYVAFLDADDEWLPTFLEKSMARLEAHPNCVLAVSGQLRGANRQNWSASVMKPLGITPGVWRLPQDLPPTSYKTNLDSLHSGAIVCDRNVLQQFGGFYDKDHCTYGEDIYLWLQIILNYPIYRSFEPLMWYHTEASDLAVWQRKICPPWPMLLDPETIRNNCPQDYRELLEKLLANYALIAAYRAATQGDVDMAQTLLKQFPQSQEYFSETWRIRLEMLISAVPNLRRSLKRFKHTLTSSNQS